MATCTISASPLCDEVAAADGHLDRRAARQGRADEVAVEVDVRAQEQADLGAADLLRPVAVERAQRVGARRGDDVQVGAAGAEQAGDRAVGVVEALGVVDEQHDRPVLDAQLGEQRTGVAARAGVGVERRAVAQW